MLLVTILTFQGFFAVYSGCIFKLLAVISGWTFLVNNGSNDVFVCSGYEGGLSLHCCGPSPCTMI